MSELIDRVSTSGGTTLEFKVPFCSVTRGRKRSQADATNGEAISQGRTPRVSKMMSLAIKMDQLVRSGTVKDYAELARLGNVTRARISQIMDLLNLAPDIVEALLYLPITTSGRDALTEQKLREITRSLDWREQRARWSSTFRGQAVDESACRTERKVR